MNPTFADGMREANRLTRAGRLAEATSLIQRLLGGGVARTPSAPPSGGPAAPGRAGPTIDAEYRVLDDRAPEARATAPRDPEPAAAPPPPRGGLAETLRRLKGLGRQGRPAPVETPPPDGAAFLAGTHAEAAGRRDYRLYIPARRPEGPMPLLVMLHGCTQTAADFAAGTRMNALAEEHGFLVLYPEQCPRANAQRCWSWFNPADQRRDAGEPALLAGLVREIARTHPVDRRRVYAAGLSAGGAAAAILAETYPDLFAAVAIHSGLPPGSARDMPSAFAAMRQGPTGASPGKGGPGGRHVPAIIFHGDRDATVNPANGAALAARFAAPGLPTAVRAAPPDGRTDGRTVTRTEQAGPDGATRMEHWVLHGAGHAWAGGSPEGSHTDPAGIDASREAVRFLLQHRLPG